MTTKNHEPINLLEIARQTMIEEGFQPDFPPSVEKEVQQELANRNNSFPAARDLRSLLWSSIDNQTSRDLDQIEFVQTNGNGRTRVFIGIADVDAYVRKTSALDDHAYQNTTSIYTGVITFPMLPEELSTDITSLLGNEDRQALVIAFDVTQDGTTSNTEVYTAVVHNYAKLSYEGVGRWLDDDGPTPPEIASVHQLEQQIRLQANIASRLRQLRKRHGALELTTVQTSIVTNDKGEVVDLVVDEPNSAREIIENFMVAANVAMAEFLDQHGVLSLRRVVRTPENWPRIREVASEAGEVLPSAPDAVALDRFLEKRRQADPVRFPDLSLAIIKLLGPGDYVVQRPGEKNEGHFGLAVHNYTHSTAPNRRYADLITQRLLKACLSNSEPPYSFEQMQAIADHCNERESAARKVERKMRKVGAAQLLVNRIGEQFDAIVTGVTSKGTFARTLKPPVDGLVVQGQHQLKVGQRVRVRLVGVEPAKGFIDFAVSR